MAKKFFHKWGEWVIDKENCIATRTCTKSDCNYCREQIEKHDFSNWEYIQSDSCVQYRKCKNVKCSKIETKEADHHFGAWEYHTENCCEMKRVCIHCGHVEYKIEHTPQKRTSRNNECSEEHYCTRCNEVLEISQNHDWSPKVLPYSECLSLKINDLESQIDRLSNTALLYSASDPDYINIQLKIISLKDILKKTEDLKHSVEPGDLGTFCTRCKQPLYLGKSKQRSQKISGFLSYSWNDAPYANKIDEALKKSGIYITRDIRDLDIGVNLHKFMNRVENSKYVIVVISDSYLKSKNCMYEAVKVVSTLIRDNRCLLLPIIIDLNISSMETRNKYMQYWINKKAEQTLHGQSPYEAKIYQDILDHTAEFFDMVSERKYETISTPEDLNIPIISQIVKKISEVSANVVL